MERALGIGALRHAGKPSIPPRVVAAVWYQTRVDAFGPFVVVVGAVAVLVAMSEFAGGLASRVTLRGPLSWLAGFISGLLGGLVGNQGGIRSAGLLAFDLPKRAFVATATTVGLLVDAARLPVYLATEGSEMFAVVGLMAWATAGVVVGTVFGGRLLARVPERYFRKVVAVILALLGISMLVQV